MPELALGAGEPDGDIHRGVIRNVEKQDLRGADREERQSLRARRQAFVEALLKGRPDGPETAKAYDRDRTREGPVTAAQPGGGPEALESVVEGAPAAQHVGDGFPGEPPRLEPGCGGVRFIGRRACGGAQRTRARQVLTVFMSFSTSRGELRRRQDRV